MKLVDLYGSCREGASPRRMGAQDRGRRGTHKGPLPLRRALGVSLTAIVFAGLAGVASLILHGPAPILSGSLPALVPIFAGGLIGTLWWGVDTTIEVRCRTKAA